MCKDQESIQLSTTPDPGYQWKSDRLTVRHQPKYQAPTISSIDKSLSLSRNRHRVQPTGVQLKRKAKLPTVIGLTTKHAVCCNTLML